MKYLPFILLLCGCHSLDKKIIQQSTGPDLDPNHAQQSFVISSKSQPEPLVIIVNTTQPWRIDWNIEMADTNMPQAGVEFDVQKCNDIANPVWSLYCRTNQPPVPFFSLGDTGYFRVGVHLINITQVPAPFGR